MSFYNRDKADTISPQKYTHHPLFACYLKAKVERERLLDSQFVSTIHPTSVFQDRERSSWSPCSQSRVVSLHRRRATGWMWGQQYSGWLCCSHPEEQHDRWPHAMKNIQTLLVLPSEKCRRMAARWLASSVAVGDVLMQELVVPCIYISGENKNTSTV